jgi:hypothetical protein
VSGGVSAAALSEIGPVAAAATSSAAALGADVLGGDPELVDGPKTGLGVGKALRIRIRSSMQR